MRTVFPQACNLYGLSSVLKLTIPELPEQKAGKKNNRKPEIFWRIEILSYRDNKRIKDPLSLSRANSNSYLRHSHQIQATTWCMTQNTLGSPTKKNSMESKHEQWNRREPPSHTSQKDLHQSHGIAVLNQFYLKLGFAISIRTTDSNHQNV